MSTVQQTGIQLDVFPDVEMEVDYERLPTENAFVHMVAGGAAGIMEHCVMYPVDIVKTRMQSLRPTTNAIYNGGIFNAIKSMVRSEGMLAPFRGMSVVATGAGPAHALYFSSYEFSKKVLNSKEMVHAHFVHGISGVVATLLHDGFMTPVEVIKQRLQVYGSPYKNAFHCALTVFRKEGIFAFYRSYTTQLTMNIPSQCTNFIVYEAFRKNLNPGGQYDPRTHILAGAAAGIASSAVTTPLDVAKTLLNTQEATVRAEQHHIQGMLNALKIIYQQSGIFGYFKGLWPRIIYQMPATAICWSVYEAFKHLLKWDAETVGT